MQPKTELYWAISLVSSGGAALMLSPIIQLNIIGGFVILGGIAFLCDYFLKPTLLKIYLKFVYDMEKEGKRLRNVALPRKNPSQTKLLDTQVNHFEWRNHIFEALEFCFVKPTKGLPASTLFKNEPNINWERQLKMQLDAFEVLKQIKSIYFSEEFRKSPESLFEFHKDYLKNKR